MPEWTIQGQVGKRLDATVRSLGTDIDATAGSIVFNSLSPDALTFSMERADYTTATNVPELGQSVTLFRDGVRFFHGHVTANPGTYSAQSAAVQVMVSGAWWWLERITLTSLKNATSTPSTFSERATFGFASADLRANIITLIDRAIALGAPMQRGTVATCFSAPAITLNQSTCGAALTELIRLVPDANAWFDYSTSPPTINVTRRGTATVRTLALGTDDFSTLNIAPVLELEVAQVRIPYRERAINGTYFNREQSAGSAVTGKVQIITTSGSELDTYLPPEKPNGFIIQTISTSAPTSDFEAIIKETNEDLLRLTRVYGPVWYGGTQINKWISQLKIANGETIPYHDSTPSISSIPTQFPTTPRLFTNSAGDEVTGNIVKPGIVLPDWYGKQFSFVNVKFTYMVYVILDWKKATNLAQPTYSISGLAEFASYAGFRENYYNVFGSAYDMRSIFWYPYTVDTYLVSQAYAAPTAVYEPPIYTYVAPPAGFAAGLLGAQNFIPYRGSITLTGDEVGAVRYRGCTVNVTGSLPEHSSMLAMVESESIDLLANTTTIGLGAPPRIDFRTFNDKVRHTATDNIIVL